MSKTAQVQLGTSAIAQQRAEAIRKQIFDNWLKTMSIGAGAGVGARSLLGLYNLGRRSFSSPAKGINAPIAVDVPVPAEEEEKLSHEKLANETWGDTLRSWVSGGKAKDPSGVPWGFAGNYALGAGSIFGGYKLTDWILDRQRKEEMQRKVDRAKQEYEAALAGQYAKASSTLPQDIAALYDDWEKAASFGHHSGQAAAIAALPLLALFAGGGMMGYNAGKKRRQAALLASARKRRQRAKQQYNPSPVVARLVHLPPTKQLEPPNEDESKPEPPFG